MVEAVAKLDIRKLTFEDIQNQLSSWGEPKFRARQIYQWLWEKGAGSFNEMTNLSKI